MKLLKRAAPYCYLALTLFLGYQWASSYVKGVSANPWQTVYLSQVETHLSPAKLQKGQERISLDCVPIQAIVPVPPSVAAPSVEPLGTPTEGLQLEYPLHLERYVLSQNLFAGSELLVDLNDKGRVDLTVVPHTPIVEVGKLRELGLWVGVEYSLEHPTNGLALDLSYQQDLFRVGPAWARLRASVGYTPSEQIRVKAQVGIPVIRF